MDTGGGKAQVVMLMPNELIDRVDALRIVMREDDKESDRYRMNRARVLETALVDGPLLRLEQAYQERLLRLEALAHRAGVTYTKYVRAYVREHERKTYAPTLEALEAAEPARK